MQCQKGQGSAFVAVAPVLTEKFRFIRGEECLKEFRASPSKRRVFCAECGSPLYSERDDLQGIRRLRLGTLDTAVHPVRQYHAFVLTAHEDCLTPGAKPGTFLVHSPSCKIF